MSIANAYKNVITETHRQQYLSEGYFILERIIPDEHLKILRDSCEYLIDLMHQEMDRQGTDHIHISHRGKRYHIAKQYDQPPRLKEYVFSPLMAEICRLTIGEEVFLFYDQYVTKAAEQGIKFSWHQDSQRVRTRGCFSLGAGGRAKRARSILRIAICR